MTIIQQKSNKNLKLLTIGLGLIAIFSVITSIFNYNSVVNFKHEVNNQTKALRETRAENADLKATLIEATDTDNMDRVISEMGLVLEKSPDYLRAKELAKAE